MPRYYIGRASQLLGISPDTFRRWADSGRLPTHRDENGHRVVEGADLAAFAVESAKDETTTEGHSHSARNHFPGIVTRVVLGDVAAQVEIQAGPHRLVSLLTREAAEELQLTEGMEAVAAIKATNVTVELP